MILTALVVAYLFATLLAVFADYHLLRRFVPSLGFVVVLMYGVTYGLGLSLWRSDPSSLYGYASHSTVGALDALAVAFSLGILSLSSAYAMSRIFLDRLLQNFPQPKESLAESAWPYKQSLSNLSYLLIAVGSAALIAMHSLGLFARLPELQSQVLQSSLIAKIIIGSSIISRLAPVGFFLLPFAWRQWSHCNRFTVAILLSLWQVIAISSGSRGLILSLPIYLLIGCVCWQKISVRSLIIILFAGSLLFLPLAEKLRVHREGNQTIPELKRTFQTFQIGKQLMGTSHEFYLMLNPKNCRADLQRLLAEDPQALSIYRMGVRSFSDESLARWHVVGLYENCSNRALNQRNFEGFSKLPFGLIPSTLYRGSPSLFDGQELSEDLSKNLDLKPGEISYATISLFADSFWRWRWTGVVFAPALIGAFLAALQTSFSWLQSKYTLYGLLAQFLVVTLVCTWINNTLLTMTWYLLWDFPKAWLELILLTIFLNRARQTASSATSP